MSELPEVHLPSEYSDDMRSGLKCGESLRGEVKVIKSKINKVTGI